MSEEEKEKEVEKAEAKVTGGHATEEEAKKDLDEALGEDAEDTIIPSWLFNPNTAAQKKADEAATPGATAAAAKAAEVEQVADIVADKVEETVGEKIDKKVEKINQKVTEKSQAEAVKSATNTLYDLLYSSGSKMRQLAASIGQATIGAGVKTAAGKALGISEKRLGLVPDTPEQPLTRAQSAYAFIKAGISHIFYGPQSGAKQDKDKDKEGPKAP